MHQTYNGRKTQMSQPSIYKIAPPKNPFIATHHNKSYNTSTLPPHRYEAGFHDNKPPPQIIRPKPLYPQKLSPLPTSAPHNRDSTSDGSLSNATPSFDRGSSLGRASDTNSFCGPSPGSEGSKIPESDNICCGCQGVINDEPGALSLPSCGHFVCGSCVDKMVPMYDGCHGDEEKLAVLSCPACNLPFSLDVRQHRGYKDSYDVTSGNYDVTSSEFEKGLDLNADNTFTQSEASINESHQSEAHECQFCDEVVMATHLCLTCRVLYCHQCLKTTHPNKIPFNQHKMRRIRNDDVTDDVMEEMTSRAEDNVMTLSCYNHADKPAEIYCTKCDLILCKNCGLSPKHDGHKMTNLQEWSRNKKTSIDRKITVAANLRNDLNRIQKGLNDSYKKVQETAENHERKLEKEREILIGIINDKFDAMNLKVREAKESKLNYLSEEAAYVSDVMENVTATIQQTKRKNYQLQHQHISPNINKMTFNKLDESIKKANEVKNTKFDIRITNFFVDFTRERSLLENIRIVQPPPSPKIQEHLCSQSHDKITLQWIESHDTSLNQSRSSIDSNQPMRSESALYEVHYAIDSSFAVNSQKRNQNNWMVLPNIKARNYTVHGLQSGTRYLFAVKAINKAGSSYSDVVAVKTLGSPFRFDQKLLKNSKKLRITNYGYTCVVTSSLSNKNDVTPSCITGDVSIETGRHYWEVVVCQSTFYSLGVACIEDFSVADLTKGSFFESWTLSRKMSVWTAKSNKSETILNVPIPFPKKIGVLLEYEAGRMLLFDGATGRLMHNFNVGKFPRPVRPFFTMKNKSLTINTGIFVPDHLQTNF